jgi:argininosuccinate lyase
VALRLVARDAALDLHDASLRLAGALARLARPLTEVPAADYTYLQPAQPTTVAHLLLTYAQPALRDAERFRAAHARLSRSVAGVGGSAGSRWPLDRDRLAELLGCEGLEVHAKDAMWQTDAYLELASALAIASTGWSQLGQDLEIQASPQFGWVALGEGHSRASALMPQKRNPYALAAVRTEAGAAAGQLVSMLVALHTGSARTDHFHLLNGELPRALERALAVARLLVAVVEELQIDVARMEAAAREGFVTAADVADLVAEQPGMDYRTAHTIVGRAIRELMAEGGPPDALDVARLEAAARAVAQADLELDPAALARALDPAACARERRQRGSSAPGEVTAMLDAADAAAGSGLRWSADTRERADAAAARLRATAAEAAVGRITPRPT